MHMGRLTALVLCAAALWTWAGIEPAWAADTGTGNAYGKTNMTFAEFWYGELEKELAVPTGSTTFDLTAPAALPGNYEDYGYSSADDEDPYMEGVDPEGARDNDSGMYAPVLRTTAGKDLGRASFAHWVLVTGRNGNQAQYLSALVYQEESPVYKVNRDILNAGDAIGGPIRLLPDTGVDIAATENWYDPDGSVGYQESLAAGRGGYQILGPAKVDVAVNKDMLANAIIIDTLGLGNDQTDLFLSQAERITFDDRAGEEVYAPKVLLANGIYGARNIQPDAAGVRELTGGAFVGNGRDGTNEIAYDSGYADVILYVYLNDFQDCLKATTDDLDGLYRDETDKDAVIRLSDFMHYAYSFQGARIDYAGEDGQWGTADDRSGGNMLYKDARFAFEEGNYISVSITKCFERFKDMGSGNYKITFIADGYKDVVVSIDGLMLEDEEYIEQQAVEEVEAYEEENEEDAEQKETQDEEQDADQNVEQDTEENEEENEEDAEQEETQDEEQNVEQNVEQKEEENEEDEEDAEQDEEQNVEQNAGENEEQSTEQNVEQMPMN